MAPQSEENSNQETVADDLKLGKVLANPEPGEEIVISGLAGQYPDSKNVYHFRDNLNNKVDMVSDDNRRWEPGHPEIPQRTGKIFDIEKFDASFFGMHYRQAHQMDPMCRLVLQVVIEAILDAGLHPADLEGTNTGVFIGVCLAGQYPDSKNVYHFRDNLNNKVDMVSDDNRRWEPGHPEIPQRTGKIFDIEKFDASFFGMHYRQAHQMDPMCRLVLQVVIEAILDAGLHPADLEGTNTGVFIGVCFSESEKPWFYDKVTHGTFAITGCDRTMIPNRISYFLKLKGPSITCDTACSSSLYALEHAYRAIRTDGCDRAIVACANLCLSPFVSLQFARLGVLSLDGSCKAFDNAGNGYARSETISAVLLQKSKEAKRIYASLLHAKTNCDGYKNSGITYPSGEMQVRLLKEFYEECESAKISELSFLEAHGTGTKVGDPEELQAIEEVFLKGRKTPLLIGSVKSNIGHTEPSSGLCSATKVIIAMETGYIPPNLHYSTPREGLKSLENGAIKVVTEKQLLKDDRGLIGINSFGFGGGNCHLLLKHNPKKKLNQGRPHDNIPRLVYVSGRTPEATTALLDSVIENKLDVEYIRLLQDIFRKTISTQPYRGFTLATKSGEICRSCKYFDSNTPPLILCFGSIDNEGRKKAKEFLEVAQFSGVVQKVHEFLSPKNISIMNILLKDNTDSVLELVLADITIQLAIADILQSLEIKPNKVFGVNKGFSLGTLVCGYFDGVLTFEETVELAYIIGSVASVTSKNGQTDLTNFIDKNSKIAIDLRNRMLKIIAKPRKLSNNVIFDVVSSEISSSYISNSFGNTKVVDNVMNVLNKKHVVFEIGNGDIGTTLRKHNRRVSFVTIQGGLQEFLLTIGRLYEMGFHPQLQNFYPKVQYPVSRGTPMISPYLKWLHDKDWFISTYKSNDIEFEQRSFKICLKRPEYTSIVGHIIDGRNLFPATGYLYLVWVCLADVHRLMPADMKVIFENCRFIRACSMPANAELEIDLCISIQRTSGNFEVTESEQTVVTGKIRMGVGDETELTSLPIPAADNGPDMTTKDVYKELRLRGYYYKGKFKAIQTCSSSGQRASIKWEENWMSFMDNMLQVKILQEDTRLLYVPTTICRLSIDAKKHLEVCTALGENPNVPVYACRSTGIIQSGGIEICGLIASSIPRRKYMATPVLEKHVFVPHIAQLKLEQAIRINMQILLENFYSIHVKAVELVDEATPEENIILGDIIHDVLADQPLIQPNITVLSKIEMEVRNVTVEDKKLLTEVDCHLVIASRLLERVNTLTIALGSIQESGFILSREPLDLDPSSFQNKNVSIVTSFSTDQEKLVFIKKTVEYKPPTAIKISSADNEFTWLPKLKSALEKNESVLLYAEQETINGIMGLINCIRREPGGQKTSIVFMQDSAPTFDLNSSFYEPQLKKQLSMNVFKNGQWGSYRHLLLDQFYQTEAEHCFLNSLVRGDLNSLKWLAGPIRSSNLTSFGPDDVLVKVYYAALNFRDVMTATGKINVDTITRDRREQECVQGFEYSGCLANGKRIMGLIDQGACGSYARADRYLLWDIPSNWSMRDAATVPVVYATSIYALIMQANVKPSNSVLIHSGTGGVGQAAINVALRAGCTVYATVGTPEKREFLKNLYPELTDDHIFNSRDTSFEKGIMRVTNGRGVDVVLNSLAEEKLLASVRCLANGGKFLEIGKFDMGNNNQLKLMLLKKQASFHGIMLDMYIKTRVSYRYTMQLLLKQYLEAGWIKPLNSTVFQMNQAEEAFRYMGSGKHTGKVLIEIRKEDHIKEHLNTTLYPCIPRYYCDSSKSYIICGGLGGFGLELADWLILRGCKKLILTSRCGIKTGYQAYRISIWRSYGCTIRIFTDDITTEAGCLSLIKKANELGVVHAIYNLAVVIQDAILANQTEEMFKISFGPKAVAAEYLDKLTRTYCPELRDFVMFSSVSCGRGNGGQTNYGMANSIMERICERRRSEGLPSLAIQWGTIGEVGLVADMQEESIEIEIGGTLQQRISNCLEVMDLFLKQTDSAVVASTVVAEKRTGIIADNIVSAVANILGIKDLKTISLQSTLAEVGMDSMTAVEIKQTLEREFEVFLTPQDIKTMTFARLQEIQDEIDSASSGVKKERALNGFEMILGHILKESLEEMPVLSIQGEITDRSKEGNIILFAGIDGLINVLEPLYKNLEGEIIALQYCDSNQKDTIEEMAGFYLEKVEENLSKSVPFNIICYSFGGAVALQLASELEKKGYTGTIICIDSSPDYLKTLANMLEVDSDDKIQVSLLAHLMSLHIPIEVVTKNLGALNDLKTFDERMELADKIVIAETKDSFRYMRTFTISIYKRLRALVTWKPDFTLQSKVILFKPKLSSVELKDSDYGLSKISEYPVQVKEFDGNHVTVLDNLELAKDINDIVWGENVTVTNKEELIINIEKEKSEVLCQ